MKRLFIMLVFIFCSIAIIFFVFGCNRNIQSQCTFHFIKETTVYDYKVKNIMCQRCLLYKKLPRDKKHKKVCISYELYPCYKIYSIEQYKFKSKNKTFSVNNVKGPTLNSTFLKVEQKFPIGSNNIRYILKKNGKTVENEYLIESLTIYSIIFFGITLLSTIIFTYIYNNCKNDSKYPNYREDVFDKPSGYVSARYKGNY